MDFFFKKKLRLNKNLLHTIIVWELHGASFHLSYFTSPYFICCTTHRFKTIVPHLLQTDSMVAHLADHRFYHRNHDASSIIVPYLAQWGQRKLALMLAPQGVRWREDTRWRWCGCRGWMKNGGGRFKLRQRKLGVEF